MKKKLLLLFTLVAIVAAAGCTSPNSETAGTETSVTYVTKYITNTDKLDIREKPANESSIICSVGKGVPVSFVEDSDNGYSKVVYNGVTGYALSAYLTLEEPSTVNNIQPQENTYSQPQADYAEVPAPQKPNNVQPQRQPSAGSSSSIISNRSTDEIETYISSYVRPLYNKVNGNSSDYSVSESNGITYWNDGRGCVKKAFSSGVNNYDMSREYYYDTESGRIAFAFVYSGGTEYRLYFRTNQLVRYIGPDGVVQNNPTAEEALELGSYVLSEAY